jgi:serine/threonine protein kinase
MFTLSDGSPIEIDDNPFNSGGEGEIFAVKHPPNHVNHVVKIYKHDQNKAARERKIEYLIHNPPPTEDNGHPFLVWPLDMVYKEDDFVGLVMRKVEGQQLEIICKEDVRPKYNGTVWETFSFKHPDAVKKRVRVAYNVAVAVARLHAKNHYVLVDLKPSNIMVNEQGLVSIIDLDSVQVMEGGNKLFPSVSNAATPDYAPPESSQHLPVMEESWDRFSLAVILFRLLVGIHPFSGTLKPPNHDRTAHHELIAGGFYPHGRRHGDFEGINRAHEQLKNYPAPIIDAFEACFDTYLLQPGQRPTALDWCRALLEKPEIIRFEADQKFVFPPAGITLRWKVDHADSISVNNGVGVVTGDAIEVTIDKPAKFILTAQHGLHRVESAPVLVGTIPLLPPQTIFMPTPQLHLQARFNTRPPFTVVLQPPSVRSPQFIRMGTVTVTARVPFNLPPEMVSATDAEGTDADPPGGNYTWVNDLLRKRRQWLHPDEYRKYKVYQWAGYLKDFIRNHFSKFSK